MLLFLKMCIGNYYMIRLFKLWEIELYVLIKKKVIKFILWWIIKMYFGFDLYYRDCLIELIKLNIIKKNRWYILMYDYNKWR